MHRDSIGLNACVGRRYPAQLCGGPKQRVALARALALEPKVLLLDEPFVALDAKVRQSLRRWLRRLYDEIHSTSVLVTHDQQQALELADRVVLMNHARITRIHSAGPPVRIELTGDDVFVPPRNSHVFVHDFSL